MGRMKFFILALASVYTKKRLDSFLHKKFLDNKKLCKKTWDDFRKNAKHPILQAYDKAEELQLTIFAYVRNGKEFGKFKNRLKTSLIH